MDDKTLEAMLATVLDMKALGTAPVIVCATRTEAVRCYNYIRAHAAITPYLLHGGLPRSQREPLFNGALSEVKPLVMVAQVGLVGWVAPDFFRACVFMSPPDERSRLQIESRLPINRVGWVSRNEKEAHDGG